AARRVARYADDAPGHRALVLVAAGHERRVRPAVAERHPETLRRADGDVGTVRAWRANQQQREQVGAKGNEPAGGVRGADRRRPVADAAVGIGVLDVRTEDVGRITLISG